MTRRTQQIAVFPFQRGLRSANSPALIDVQDINDMDNIIFTNDASRKTRPGLQSFGTLTQTENIKYIKDFWRYSAASGSQSNKVVAVGNGKVMADGGGDGVFTDITGSFTIPATDNVTSDVLANLLILAFENVTPKYYNHSGNIRNLSSTAPQGSLYRTHLGYPWLAGVPGFPHTLYRGEFENPFVWTGVTTESITIDDGDSDPDGITALFPSFYNDLYVSKRRSLYRVRLNSSGVFTVERVLRGVGCISHNSVVALQNDIIFCSERGVHSLSSTEKFGDAESTFLSAPIHDIYNEQLDFSRRKEIQATYIPEFNSYMMTFPKRGAYYRRDILALNIVTGQWYRFKDINSQSLTEFIDSQKKTRLMTVNNTGQVATFNEDQKTDFGTTAINSFFKTGIIYPLGGKRTVAFKSLTCIYKPQGTSTFSVTTNIDGSTVDTLSFDQSGTTATNLGSDFILGVSSLGQRGTVKTETKSLSGHGRGIQLTFNRNPSGSHLSQGIEIYGFIVEFIDSDEIGLSTVH